MATATDVVDPPAAGVRPPRARAWVPLLVVLTASVAARLPALVNARGVNSDAAVVGLQALHILHGEWSWFLWGAGYQASFDTALIAAAFAITGPSALTLMVVPLIGHLILKREDTTQGFVFLSSRASYELVRKSARVGVPMVVTISAPTSLAIAIAKQANLRLVSFARENSFVEYDVE